MHNQTVLLLFTALLVFVLQPTGVVGVGLTDPLEYTPPDLEASLFYESVLHVEAADTVGVGEPGMKKNLEFLLIMPEKDEENFGFYRRQNWRSFDDVSIIRRNEWLADTGAYRSAPKVIKKLEQEQIVAV